MRETRSNHANSRFWSCGSGAAKWSARPKPVRARISMRGSRRTLLPSNTSDASRTRRSLSSFQMNLQELATVVQESLPLRIAVIDNGYLGMVRKWQERFYGRRYSSVQLSGPDLMLLGKAYGIPT
ncbi:MAG TPA: hypothetical protein EYQ27_01285, partial [Gemmatimonadetes bacterium]|nr:hypothetical protein [Gemmatimonadota bacterium]